MREPMTLFNGKQKLITFAATLFLTSHFASAATPSTAQFKSFDAQQDKAVIYVYQDDVNLSSLGVALEIDQEYQGHTHQNTYIKKIVEPGTYTILSRGENLSEIEINAQPSQIYYVHKENGYGDFDSRSYLSLVDAETAQKAISKSVAVN